MHLTIAKSTTVAALLVVATCAVAQAPLSDDDKSEIQALMTRYARALGECRAEDFADLFVPATGYFASGFRGPMVGHERLALRVVNRDRRR